MTSRRQRRKEDSDLLKALKFVMAAQYRPDENRAVSAYQSHCKFYGGYVVGFNGVITAGYPCADDLQLCPNTHYFIKALEKTRGAFSLTQLDNNSLVINAGAFRAAVPCVEHYMVDGLVPDAASYPMSDDIRRCFVQAALFCAEGAQTVLASSIVTLDFSIVGTDGNAMIEAYLGYGLPRDKIIPIAFAKVVNAVDTKIVSFGFSETSFTIHFEDGAWLRTQLYQASVPDVTRILDNTSMNGLVGFPPDFYDALAAVEPFCETNAVHLTNGKIKSHETPGKGAEHECEGLVADAVYSLKYIKTLKGVMTHCDFTSMEDRAIFAGDKVRAIVMKMV